ncbi:MAG: GGDEF domain-containing protein [Candidatus Dormibacteraeota bacterium]|nr:GGDEF domain-containing protein [Candidatus Dormibacteraeota bacterium]
MTELQGAAATGGAETADAVIDDTAITRELVGWALQSPLRGGALTPDAGRRVLATALGVPEASFHHWDEQWMQNALDRLRGLVGYCERLASEATTDDLTGALRRGPGVAELSREIDRARRTSMEGLVVGFLDVNGLKAVNDAKGHAAGDDVLRAVVRAVRERVRSYDILFRYGGDEFVCVLLGATREQAERTFADISSRVVTVSGGQTVSIGLADVLDDDTAETVIARADAALYHGRAAAAG